MPRDPFSGLSAFPLTPTDAQGAIDAALLGRLIDRAIAAGVDSIGLLGSTGIYAYLTREERRLAVDVAVERVAGRVPLIVGVGALRTDHAQALAGGAAAAGADAVLLAPVSYTPLREEEAFAHYRAVAEAGGLPLCIYNNPSTTHFTFSQALLERLSALTLIRGVKMPPLADGGYEAEIARLRATTDLRIGYSGDWCMAESLGAGADAFYSVLAGLLPERVVPLVRHAQAGRMDEAREADAALAPLWDAFRAYGSLRVMYAAIEVAGLGHAVPPRPLLPLPAEDQARVRAALEPLLPAD